MAQPMYLPLRSTHIEPTWTPLETRVRQIESQKGLFRIVTEKSFQDDIDKAAAGNANAASESAESEDEDESPEMKQKKLWEAREEMMKQLLRAQNETLTALDSMSLLLSGHPKAAAGAKTSMSPALSSAVPDGTLGAQKVRPTRPSNLVEQHNESLYLGYKLDGLNKAIHEINSARSRLSEQAEHESAFWKQVADLSAQGVVISRLPRDNRSIGVHFGFAEAAPRFRNRGFAVLRMDQDGQLRLDKAITTSKRHAIQVSIFRSGKLISSSTKSHPTPSTPSLAGTVADLRRSLFEEELFFEIGREARNIANQGVAIVGDTITADISDGEKMRIDLDEQDEHHSEDDMPNHDVADGIILCLRGLLSKGHEQNLARRSQTPAPMIPKSPTSPEYALLRPLLSHMRQTSLVSVLQSWCSSMKVTMQTAGVSLDINSTCGMLVEPPGRRRPHHALLLDTLLAPADSIIKIMLPTGRKFEVEIRTHLAPPAFGSVFTATPIEYGSDASTPPKMSNLDAVKSRICKILTADLVQWIVETQESKHGVQKGPKVAGNHSGAVKSKHASLYIQANLDTSLTLRYHNHSGSNPLAEGDAWVWHTERMLHAAAGAREVQEPRHLIEIITELFSNDK